MKVKELITELQKFDSELEVEICGYTYQLSAVNNEFKFSVGNSIIQEFRSKKWKNLKRHKQVALITFEDKEDQ